MSAAAAITAAAVTAAAVAAAAVTAAAAADAPRHLTEWLFCSVPSCNTMYSVASCYQKLSSPTT